MHCTKMIANQILNTKQLRLSQILCTRTERGVGEAKYTTGQVDFILYVIFPLKTN